ncbi:MAG: hypothetical protein Fur009_7500 [Candidatus Microgenomates bacterium]
MPIIALNLKPIYVDIENQSFSMNPIDLQNKLSNKSKVLILQYTFGITPSQRQTIISFVKQHNLVLIEDIAHGIQISNIKNQISKRNNHFFFLSFGRSKRLSLDRVEYKLKRCPNAEKICQQIINLSTNINLNQAKKIINALKTLNDV